MSKNKFSKIIPLLKSSIKLITIFIPQSILIRITIDTALWAVDSLIKNKKFNDRKLNDKVLILKKDLQELKK